MIDNRPDQPKGNRRMSPSHNECLAEAATLPDFWRCYVLDGAEDELKAKAIELTEDTLGEPEVHFPIGPSWFLSLKLQLWSLGDDTHVLSLADVWLPEGTDSKIEEGNHHADSEHRLGHWDLMHAQPFCLRWEELEAVVATMRAAPDIQQTTPELAMLLLSRFVGHSADERHLVKPRREMLAHELEQLGVFRGKKAKAMARRLLCGPPDRDYRWVWDGSGWMLGGEYPHYSQRNLCYSFPHEEYNEFRRLIGLADPAAKTPPI
ncbi:hypothetical protein [Actinoplanes sp. NPDC049118]|uniref:hypothetical protein n=1 Tax=Actinoplanes sp. NPDC049118 TaxID=3155769 RepID=UPI0033E70B96